MKVDGKPFRRIWRATDGWSVSAIDPRRLPHELRYAVEFFFCSAARLVMAAPAATSAATRAGA